MKILIAGINGYMGTSLYRHLTEQGHDVVGFDNNSREANVAEVGSKSVVKKATVPYKRLDASDYLSLKSFIKETKPDTIIWLAEQPSAPFSQIDQIHASDTIENNTKGTMNVLYAIKEINPAIHLIKIGTEGEYPSDIWDGKHIPEGDKITVQHQGKNWEIPTPRGFSSWYHSTKFYESYLCSYACKIWNLKITDINQGIIFGHRNGTRLDVDEFFGTVVNRFVAQAVVGLPLSIYGTGGQTRGMINLQNSMEAIELLSENPAEQGEFRVVHQTTQEYSVKQVAEMIQKLTGCEIEYIENPRVELAENKFTFDTSTLSNLGLKEISLKEELPRLIETMKKNKKRIVKEALSPKKYTQWK